MPDRKIISVGFEVPGGVVEYLPYDSDHSLLDADIIIFKPGIPFYNKIEECQGKDVLSESNSFSAAEATKHWQSEIKSAIESGKLIIVFMNKPVDVFIHTGQKDISGTGRNRIIKNLVRPLRSYDTLPIAFTNVVPRGGEIIVAANDLKYLASYWKEFGSSSKYEAYFEGTFSNVFLTTKTGNKIVGASLEHKSGGTILLLPPLCYDVQKFTIYDKKKKSDLWTDEAVAFGERMVGALVAIDKALKADRGITAPPSWTQSSEFRLIRETEIEGEIQRVNAEITEQKEKKASLLAELSAEGSLRHLLFEKGHPLEVAMLDALQLLGFTAETFKDAESEFDAVFISEEGRFWGEAEGKDNKPINIDKLSQLERNLQEDFTKEGISEYAKGVLFGNAFRLSPLNERGDFFTSKCVSGAKRSKVALVRTPDLFPIARYLKEHPNPDFSRKCRLAILQTQGAIVEFPLVPNLPSTTIETKVEKLGSKKDL